MITRALNHLDNDERTLKNINKYKRTEIFLEITFNKQKKFVTTLTRFRTPNIWVSIWCRWSQEHWIIWTTMTEPSKTKKEKITEISLEIPLNKQKTFVITLTRFRTPNIWVSIWCRWPQEPWRLWTAMKRCTWTETIAETPNCGEARERDTLYIF